MLCSYSSAVPHTDHIWKPHGRHVLHRWLFSSFTPVTTEGPSLAPTVTFLSLHPTLTLHGEAPLGLVTPPCIWSFLPLPGPLFQTLPIVFGKLSLHALDTDSSSSHALASHQAAQTVVSL